jgi:single-strand DNA-binding protein
MNKVILIGNLTKAPECAKTEKGINYARFSIAVNRDYKDANGEKITDFFNVIAWRQLADLCYKYLDKGNKVCVVGSIENRSFENKDGQKINTYDIKADEVEFLTPKLDNSKTATESNESDIAKLEKVNTDDMPF